jgi:hypothetical protein
MQPLATAARIAGLVAALFALGISVQHTRGRAAFERSTVSLGLGNRAQTILDATEAARAVAPFSQYPRLATERLLALATDAENQGDFTSARGALRAILSAESSTGQSSATPLALACHARLALLEHRLDVRASDVGRAPHRGSSKEEPVQPGAPTASTDSPVIAFAEPAAAPAPIPTPASPMRAGYAAGLPFAAAALALVAMAVVGARNIRVSSALAALAILAFCIGIIAARA